MVEREVFETSKVIKPSDLQSDAITRLGDRSILKLVSLARLFTCTGSSISSSYRLVSVTTVGRVTPPPCDPTHVDFGLTLEDNRLILKLG